MDDQPSAAPSGPLPGFYGRDDELAGLCDLFAEVAKTHVPRLAVIVAGSGIGKTALVQALYRKLTADPQWDGASPDGFWPDAFQGSGDDLKVNPDFPKDYRPGGPPKFMWLGMRWQDPDPLNRNQDGRRCPLPEALEVLYRHVKVVQGMPGLWRGFLGRLGKKGAHLRKGLAEEGVTYAVEGAVNLAVGPVAPVVKLGLSAFREARRDRGLLHPDLEESTERNAGDELCLELGGLMGGERPVPTILWLDDAHWIDPSSLEFLGKLARRAKREKWPLLAIATHWEREWLETRGDGRESARSFASFALDSNGGLGAEVLELKKVVPNAHRSLLEERLPGLTADQQKLIIDKSDGNFLTLKLNIEHLLSEDRDFVNCDQNNPLTQDAMVLIEGWESDWDKRVEQRFKKLEGEVKDVLGWSSRAGVRFITRMIAEFAQGRIVDAEGRISRCDDPYAILAGSADRAVMEFRDRAYYRYAIKFFEAYLRKDHEELRTFIGDWFSDWVNCCFDDDGRTLSPDSASESSLLAASPTQRVELLEMAIEALPLQDMHGSTDARAIAALRAHCLLAEAYSQARLWDQCRKIGKSMGEVDWGVVPLTVMCSARREDICSHLVTAGALDAASGIAESLLADSQKLFEDLDTPESLRGVAVSLDRLGDIEEQRGELDQAYERYSKALGIRRRLAEDLSTPESFRDVAVSLSRLGDIEGQRGELDRDYERHSEALEIGRRLAEDLSTPQSLRNFALRNVAVSLSRLGDIEGQRGKLDRAYERYTEALEIARRLAEDLSTPESFRDVAVLLSPLGDIEEQRGELDRAYERYTEALEIARRLAEDLGTPQSLGVVSLSLDRLGGIEEQRGELDQAYERYTEALGIRRRLAEDLSTPESFRDVAVSLGCLGDIEEQRGELDRAYERYTEALEIARRLAEDLSTPESFRDVAVLLSRLGGLEEQRGELDRAYERHSEALEIRRRLAEDLSTPQSLEVVSVSLSRLGGLEEQRGELDRAYERYSEALEIRRRLAEDLSTPQSLLDVSVSLSRLGDIEEERGELDRAYERYSEALEIRRRLAEDLSTPQSFRDVSVSLDRLGGIEEQRGELDRAYERHSEALEIDRRLAEDLSTPQSFQDISVSLDRLGDIEEQRGELDRAYERHSEALEIRRRLAEDPSTPQSFRDVSVSLSRLGGIEEQRGELDRAYERHSEALEIRRRLAKDLSTPQSFRDVSVSLDRLGGIEEQRGELDRAYERYSEALEIDRRLAEDLSTSQSLGDIFLSLSRLGDIEKQRGELDRAYERHSEALEIGRRLAEDLSTPQSLRNVDLRNVAVSLSRLGDIEEERGELDRAYERYTEALEIGQRLAEWFDTPQSYEDVAEMEQKTRAIQALLLTTNANRNRD